MLNNEPDPDSTPTRPRLESWLGGRMGDLVG